MRQGLVLLSITALLLLAAGGVALVIQESGRAVLPEPEVPAALFQDQGEPAGAVPEMPAQAPPAAAPQPEVQSLDISVVPGVHPAFRVRAAVPAGWRVVAVPGIEAVNIYDPAALGDSALEQSQIFLRHFRANDFLTLSTVRVYSRRATRVSGLPAVIYDIEKLPAAANFPQQPAWRNGRHTVVDVRVSTSNPSEFIVIGKRPELSQDDFDTFLASLDFDEPGDQSLLVPPVDGFAAAVRLKPFGIYITPDTSPVQPDRFTGYHTGADAELPADTPVFAIADGVVVQSGSVSGYGGMAAIEHEIAGVRYTGIYGHLDPASLPSRGVRVARGEIIGRLGEGFSDETDGARAHLHFALYRGAGMDIRGYVPRQEELDGWIDPTAFFSGS